MAIIITGADGFIGRNLRVRLRESGRDGEMVLVTRSTTPQELAAALREATFVFHLAGVNRPREASEFTEGNVGLTAALCAGLRAAGNRAPIIYASSTQAALDNPYGRSKRAAEEVLQQHAREGGGPVSIYRLPGVFGKWCRPNYNSVVATFCHNIARGLPIQIADPAAALRLVYVDDVVAAFTQRMQDVQPGAHFCEVEPVYATTVGELAEAIRSFHQCRDTLLIDAVGTGFKHALYATYVSYLPTEAFDYGVAAHGDARGVFVEMLKTRDSGQFSYFTAHPGITRGRHYHHSKTEKFLVIRGRARFAFRHILTDETFELHTAGDEPRIVETVPGWAHDITNVGEDELIVMIWANENFDPQRPDTYPHRV